MAFSQPTTQTIIYSVNSPFFVQVFVKVRVAAMDLKRDSCNPSTVVLKIQIRNTKRVIYSCPAINEREKFQTKNPNCAHNKALDMCNCS
jgi:hypothetical protein